MSEPITETTKGGRNTRGTWLIAIGLALIFLWLIYSATQTATGYPSSSSLPGTNGVIATPMPQNMPSMNH
ncbi:MAG: hypothetical protein ABI835_04925 [Chloroflexota bacterium]